jgi:osmoprotectant transport system substrate-binding protein
VVVASFNFDESELLAEIYAQALEAEGIAVRRELRLGPRELVAPALQQGLVDLVPEYVGSVTAWLGGDDVDLTDEEVAERALRRAAARWDLEALQTSRAENPNTLAVTRSLALVHRLSDISDLGSIAATLTIGGPAECPRRPYCLPGLRATYGLRFDRFVTVDGTDRVVQALREGVVDVAVMFRTDGALADPDLISLGDDRGLNPSERVVPLVRTSALDEHGPELRKVVDAVSRRLTTSMLRFLNWRVSVAGNDAASEARGWLLRQGLIDRP